MKRYYFGDLLSRAGIKDSVMKQKLNVANACWSFVCAFIASFLVKKFRRRTLFLYCTISMLLCYTAWTISMQQAESALDAGWDNKSAGK
jgi:Na+/melibiose symporter-like transporter